MRGIACGNQTYYHMVPIGEGSFPPSYDGVTLRDQVSPPDCFDKTRESGKLDPHKKKPSTTEDHSRECPRHTSRGKFDLCQIKTTITEVQGEVCPKHESGKLDLCKKKSVIMED